MELLKYAVAAKLAYNNKITESYMGRYTRYGIVLEPLHFINKDHAQCWVMRDDRELIVSFRGTDSVQDALSNVNIWPINFYCGGKVHMGYMNYYERLRLDILSYILYHIAFSNISNITFVGHSLGASVLLCALEVSYMLNVHNVPLNCYTFGAPPIGNKEFAANFNNRIKNVWRVVYDSDIVPRVPNLYNHIGTPLILKHDDIVLPKKKQVYIKCIEHHNMEFYLKGIKRGIAPGVMKTL